MWPVFRDIRDEEWIGCERGPHTAAQLFDALKQGYCGKFQARAAEAGHGACPGKAGRAAKDRFPGCGWRYSIGIATETTLTEVP